MTNWGLANRASIVMMWARSTAVEKDRRGQIEKTSRHSFGNKQVWVQIPTSSLSCEPQSFCFLTCKTRIMQCSERLIGKTQLMYLAMCLTQVSRMILSVEFYDELIKVKTQRWFSTVYLAWIKDNKIKNIIPLTEGWEMGEELNMFSGWGEGTSSKRKIFLN